MGSGRDRGRESGWGEWVGEVSSIQFFFILEFC